MSNIAEWRAELATGSAKIDSQHRHLLELARKVVDSFDTAGCDRETFHCHLNELAVLADEHFATEEALLSAHGDPLLSKHRAEHDQYREQITGLLMAAMRGKLDRAGLCQVLHDWTTHHLLETDMGSRQYLVEHHAP